MITNNSNESDLEFGHFMYAPKDVALGDLKLNNFKISRFTYSLTSVTRGNVRFFFISQGESA